MKRATGTGDAPSAPAQSKFDPDRFIADRMRGIDASGIRRVFDLAATMREPINLSIGQPDFDVPAPIKAAAIRAIESGFNAYTVTQGMRELRDKITGRIGAEFSNWKHVSKGGTFETLVTSGVSGGLLLALLCCVGPGDEVLVPDPYFVMYRQLVYLVGATPVLVDTYPDFRLTPERVERYVTGKTRMLLMNSPSNPTGVVATDRECREIAALADRHGFLLVSDEIYDEFCYEKCVPPEGPAGVAGAGGSKPRCPSPAAYSDRLLLMRGFSKTYGMTGWRLGWAAGPRAIIDQMTKLQQYSFVCAPSPAQAGGVAALDVDMGEYIEAYRRKRDRVVERLSERYEVTVPGGAFYAFPKVPERLGLTATQFVEKAVKQHKVLMIPGSIFSARDTHFRISYACDDKTLELGLDALVEMAKG